MSIAAARFRFTSTRLTGGITVGERFTGAAALPFAFAAEFDSRSDWIDWDGTADSNPGDAFRETFGDGARVASIGGVSGTGCVRSRFDGDSESSMDGESESVLPCPAGLLLICVAEFLLPGFAAGETES